MVLLAGWALGVWGGYGRLVPLRILSKSSLRRFMPDMRPSSPMAASLPAGHLGIGAVLAVKFIELFGGGFGEMDDA